MNDTEFNHFLSEYLKRRAEGAPKDHLGKEHMTQLNRVQFERLMFYDFILMNYEYLIVAAVEGDKEADKIVDIVMRAWFERALIADKCKKEDIKFFRVPLSDN